jgi:uncharacterized protein YwgA
MSGLGRTHLLMMLLAAEGAQKQPAEPVQGTTRLQKLLFLVENEARVKPDVGKDYDFEAWKFGPVSKELYDDLEKLENLGFLESEPVASASSTEVDEYGLSFDDLMGDERTESEKSLEERNYRLSPKGLEWLRQKVDLNRVNPTFEKIRRVKSQYGGLSLQDLLYYVYTKYPDMTSASEIRGKVLRR